MFEPVWYDKRIHDIMPKLVATLTITSYWKSNKNSILASRIYETTKEGRKERNLSIEGKYRLKTKTIRIKPKKSRKKQGF